MRNVLYFAWVMLFFISCTKDEDTKSAKTYGDGVFVINEGPFGNGVGTLTHINDDDETVQQVFEKENNGSVLGNIVNSMIYHDGKYYTVVNNANKVVVTDEDMKYVGEIKGLFAPRYMVVKGQTGYISEWGENNQKGGVAIVDLNTLTITKRIATGNGPEELLIDGNLLYVPNGGSYDAVTFASQPDSTVTVIDLQFENIREQISVKYNPNAIVKTSSGYIISCAEKSYQSANGRLAYITPISVTAEQIDVSGFPALSSGSFAKLRPYKTNGAVVIKDGSAVHTVTLGTDGKSVSNSEKVSDGYSAMYNERKNLLYVADAKDFNSIGEVHTFDNNGTKKKSYTAGIIPGNFCFR